VTVSVTARNLAANLFGSVWTALLSILFVPVYLRFLGAEAFGLVGLLAALQAVFGLLDLGLGATFNREMARLSASGSDGTRERDLLRTLEVVYIAVAAAVAVAVAVFAGPIAHRWVHARNLAPAAITKSIVMMGFIIACQFPFSLYQAGLLGRQRHVRVNVIAVSTTTVRTIGAVLLIWRVAASIELFFAWQALLMLVQVIVTALVLWRELPPAEQRPRVRLPLIRELWAFSLAFGGSAILGVILSQTDKVLLSGMLPLAQFGYYTLAGTVAAALWYAINPIATAYYPRFTEDLHRDGGERAVDTYHRACQLMAAVVLPIAAVIAAFAHQLIFIWTRNAALAQATALTASLLVCGTTLNGLANLPIMLGVAAGFPFIVTLTNSIAVLVVVPALFVATRRFGIVGAAAVWVFLNSLYVVIAVPLTHRRVMRSEIGRWLGEDVAKPLIVAAGCAAISRLLLPADLTIVGTAAYVAASGIITAFATAMVLPSIRSLAMSIVLSRRGKAYGN
jgi:O-antigen/teichoic acid export membrane protein